MKNLRLFILPIIILAFLISCSEDDSFSEDSGEQQVFSGNFFPLTVGDTWNYAVESTNNTTNEVVNNDDELLVESESTTGFTLSVNQGGIANGTMSSILTSGELSRTNTTLAANGTVGLPLDGFDFEIELDNALLYNTEANNGAQLSVKTGVLTQDLEGYPMTINYTLKSKQLENLDTLTVEGITYNLVTSSNISLELSVSTEITAFGITQAISILDNQEVLSVNSFYAENVGLVEANAVTSYELNTATLTILEQIGTDLNGLETSMSITNTQSLTNYSVTE